MKMVHNDYKEMIPARALLALDAAEARLLDQHLATCDECSAELEEWEATAAAMAVSAKPQEPSPKVRERILDEVRKDLTDPQVIPFRSTPRNIWSSFGSLGAMAAVVMMAVMIVGLIVLWRENQATKESLAQVSRDLDVARQDLQRTNQFFQLVNSPGSKVVELAGNTRAVGASAKLAYDAAGRAMLVAHGLPGVPQGKEYQLWFIVHGRPPMPGKTFAPDTSGSAMMMDSVPEMARSAAEFAVTLEPSGGVDSPTGQMYLTGGI